MASPRFTDSHMVDVQLELSKSQSNTGDFRRHDEVNTRSLI